MMQCTQIYTVQPLAFIGFLGQFFLHLYQLSLYQTKKLLEEGVDEYGWKLEAVLLLLGKGMCQHKKGTPHSAGRNGSGATFL